MTAPFDKTRARPARRSRRRAGAGLVVASAAGLLAAILAPGLGAQVPPDGDWLTRTTPHFRVTHPERLPELGRRAAERAEAAYRVLEEAFLEAPDGRIDVLVTDHTDTTNGFARVFPTNQVVVFAPPPTDGLSLSYFDGWLDLVLVHELAHVFHMDRPGTPGSIFRSVFGRVPVPWPSFPGLATPGWTREGLATWYESALTDAGRARGTYFETIVRTAALEGAFEELDEASGRSPVWPDGDRPYVYGSLFFNHLLERHGRETMASFVRATADQWIPYRPGAAAEEAFGVGFGEAWARWRAEVEARARATADSLRARAPLTETEPLTRHGRWALRPTPSPDGGAVAYIRSDGTTDVQLHLLDAGGWEGRKLTRTNGLSDFAWTPDGGLVFAQLEFTDRYRLRSDLYRMGPDGDGEPDRLTRGARLDQPDVAPGGAVAVAVQAGEGTSRLVEVDLADGSVRPLTPFEDGVHWAYPRISPDGRRIAASRWTAGAYFDVVLLDRDGRLLHRVTRDRAVDLAPSWSPDGRWLVWASDRTGIWNVLAVPVPAADGAPGPARQLTNVVTGVAYPSVGPRGRWLYVSAYHADGWRIERAPFRPEDGLEPFPPDPRFRPDGPDGRLAAAGSVTPVDEVQPDVPVGSPEPYSAAPTILPRYWLPDLLPAESAFAVTPDETVGPLDVLGTAVGVRTSGEDLLRRHAYSARALVSPETGRFHGRAAYRYAGFGNPAVEVTVSQLHDAAPRGELARDPLGREEVLFQVQREREVGLTAELLRRRYRDALSLRVGGGYIREHTSLLTPDLEESSLFRPVVPDRDLLEARIQVAGDHTRFHPFSISPEDGARALVRLRSRWDVGLDDALVGRPGGDRSFQDAVAEVRLYGAFDGPGFANHVLAARGAAGAARKVGADAFHYEVGGAPGSPEPLTGFGIFGGSRLLFPVRGFGEGARFGRYAWSATAEYRFPLVLVHEGAGLLPLHLDRMSGSVFLDGGNAWGPRLGGGSIRFQNDRRPALVSTGAEVSAVVLPFWAATLTVRTGLAVPLRGAGGTRDPSFYLRLGASF